MGATVARTLFHLFTVALFTFYLVAKALTNNSFNSVAELTETIDIWAQSWNENPQPIAWTQPANDIIAKVKRGRAALTKFATDH